jgi:protoporphyrinogen oxidase
MKSNNYILGAGVTGLAAGIASSRSVSEAADTPGGICSSYYVRPGESTRLIESPPDSDAYRFEIGGGHWIFGGDPTVLHFIDRLSPVRSYDRLSAVYFRNDDLYVDYPIQNNLRFLPSAFASQALIEMSASTGRFRTMRDWQQDYFGGTLCEKFFFPFHELYTAGLYTQIAPQDAYKSPVDLTKAIQGMFAPADAVGYNTRFVYPIDGLNQLSRAMAARADVRYGKRATTIDVRAKVVTFADGTVERYDRLICTLPLNQTMAMTGLAVEARPDPYSSVLVLNIGAVKGPQCPPHHWLYNPDAKSGFHRVGFYSNVDPSFLPASHRERASAVSIYVERAYPGGQQPTPAEVTAYADATVRELTDWGYIERAEVVDPT